METRTFQIDSNNSGIRIDKYLSRAVSDCSRSYLQGLINKGLVEVNGHPVKKSHRLEYGDRVRLSIPEPEFPDIEPVPMDLDIIYEDKQLMVINKPAGLTVHPVPGNRKQTLVNGLLAYTSDLSGIAGVKRPGIVHRLDKGTSGALVVAKEDRSHRHLIRQFKKRKVTKIYRALVHGQLPYRQGKIEAPIGRDPKNRTKMAVIDNNSRQAVTGFKLLASSADYSYVEADLKTGRTHQIRVHFSYIEHPVVGDEKYGEGRQQPGVGRQLLHAYQLGFFHPVSGEWKQFIAPIPEDMKEFLEKIGFTP